MQKPCVIITITLLLGFTAFYMAHPFTYYENLEAWYPAIYITLICGFVVADQVLDLQNK